jgi:Tol biopolymer transport system component
MPSKKTSFFGLVFCAFVSACAGSPAPASPAKVAPAAAPPKTAPALGQEQHLTDLRQLSFGGENAEAYWSFDGRELTMQSKRDGAECDRIFRFSPFDAAPQLVPVSSGKGATTCSYFMPGNQELIFASTHLAGDACPPPPDRSKGYTWALYDSYDIFKTSRNGGPLVRLTETPGYDAEGTVCEKDGSIIFTSVRDGDIDLYRMDRDGKDVRRLTSTPGYDGGAFFNRDCSRIVWRASRPKVGAELDEYRALLAQGLVRPSKLEIYVANADGSDPVQLTYLDAASFAPYWHPSGKRILFSSNYGDPKHREFDIFAINDNGTGFERITYAAGFDGFPMFSPDGKTLAFSSNRATPPGQHDTNVFTARWVEGKTNAVLGAPDRVLSDIAYLADPAREGRGVGTAGLEASGAFLEQRLQSLGLTPAGDAGSYRQKFPVATALERGPETRLSLDGKPLSADDFTPIGFSPASAEARAELVLAGYGIVAKDLGVDDYAHVDAKNKIVLVRRFVPDDPKFSSTESKRRYGDLRFKAWLAKQRGARGLIVVDAPSAPAAAGKDFKAPEEAPLPKLTPEGYGDAGIPVLAVKRAAAADWLAKLEHRQRVPGELVLRLNRLEKPAFNVIGRIAAEPGAGAKLPGAIVIGAHYDHLGFGGRYSLAPERSEPHVGADDNASGTAVLLEIARALREQRSTLRRDIVVAAFSGEESGLLGSAHFVRQGEQKAPGALGPKDIYAMLNLDMVGRLRDNRVQVLGTETAKEWEGMLGPQCNKALLDCAFARDGGYGPSDQMSFFVAKVPVLHFFTGSHTDYHKPSDTVDKVNAGGAAQIGKLVSQMVSELSTREAPLTLREDAAGPPPRGDLRSFNASLGSFPDYAGAGPGKPGVLLGGVRPGGAADKAGLRRGDLLTRVGKNEIRSIEDLMFVLNSSHPGQSSSVTVIRDGKPVQFEVTFQEAVARPR